MKNETYISVEKRMSNNESLADLWVNPVVKTKKRKSNLF